MRSEMSVSRFMIAVFVGAALSAAACSEHAQQETKEAGSAIADDARSGADKAADQSRETGRDIADATKEASRDVADAAKEAGRDVADAARATAGKTKEVARDVADATRRTADDAAEVGSDGWITTKVKAKLIDESLLKDSDINVDTNNHVVTLKGSVASAAGKARAESVAKGTEGVTRVVNQLVVKVSTGC
jgi:hyperosmotically inducible protein